MDRIAARFEALREAGRKGLVGYLTAGDPDIQTSERNIRAAIENGLDVLELGAPFSDPTSDGPVIQEASRRALAAGITLGSVFEMVERLRRDVDVPIVLFGYANPFFQYGYEAVCKDAAEAGVDGLLVVDLPFEEAEELRGFMRPRGLRFIPLIAPTTPAKRAADILARAEGFIYYIMVTGVTGVRTNVVADVGEHIEPLRRFTKLPIAVGFGVSNGEQAQQVAAAADAVVVGSALIRAAEEGKLVERVRELRSALDAAFGARGAG